MSDDDRQPLEEFIPVFARRVEGAGPMTDKEAHSLSDLINHPTHYTRGRIEVWDFIVDQRMGFLAGNVIKYLCRAGHKGDKMTDLRKAKAYLDKLIESEDPRP